MVKSLKLKCDNCVNFVTKWTAPSSQARDDITLVSSKDRGGLTKTHPAIDEICLGTEKAVRSVVQAVGLTPNIFQTVVNRSLTHVLLNNLHTPFECASHSTELAKAVVKRYALIRLRFETTKADAASKSENIRQKLSRLILFSNV